MCWRENGEEYKLLITAYRYINPVYTGFESTFGPRPGNGSTSGGGIRIYMECNLDSSGTYIQFAWEV